MPETSFEYTVKQAVEKEIFQSQ